jgi:hypothetical protein
MGPEESAPAPQKILRLTKNKTFIKPALIALSVLIIGGSLFGVTRGLNKNVLSKNDQYIKSSSIFQAQSATIDGEVTEIKGTNLVIKNTKGEVGEFPVSEKFSVYKYASDATPPTITQGAGGVQLNKNGQIYLTVKNTQYEIVSISYLP